MVSGSIDFKGEFTGWGNAYEFGIGYPINAFPETLTIYSNFSVNEPYNFPCIGFYR